jgi:hypothetical protein
MQMMTLLMKIYWQYILFLLMCLLNTNLTQDDDKQFELSYMNYIVGFM